MSNKHFFEIDDFYFHVVKNLMFFPSVICFFLIQSVKYCLTQNALEMLISFSLKKNKPYKYWWLQMFLNKMIKWEENILERKQVYTWKTSFSPKNPYYIKSCQYN